LLNILPHSISGIKNKLTLPIFTPARIILARPNSVEEMPAIWPVQVSPRCYIVKSILNWPRIFSHPTSQPTCHAKCHVDLPPV
jgi:hypothetical protein